MKLKHISLAALSAFAIAGSASATVLLTDNFNTANNDSSTFNDNLTSDQGGTLAPVNYSISAPGANYSIQHSNNGAMLIANVGGNNWVSPNYDFSAAPTGLEPTLVIEFDAWVTDGASYSWLGFGIGASQGTDFYSQPYGTNFVQSSGSHSYKFVISDTNGTGSAFNGITNGAKVDFYIDTVLQSSTAVTLATTGSGYLTFKQDQWDGWSIGHVDNLSVSIIPEPSAALLGGLGMLALLRRRR